MTGTSACAATPKSGPAGRRSAKPWETGSLLTETPDWSNSHERRRLQPFPLARDATATALVPDSVVPRRAGVGWDHRLCAGEGAVGPLIEHSGPVLVRSSNEINPFLFRSLFPPRIGQTGPFH